MELTLDRFSYASTETEGVLSVADFDLATIERPWVHWDDAGGKPFQSCVPDGRYILEPWTRPNRGEVYILSNPELGVYRLKEDRPHGVGRYLVLIHVANYVSDVVGCIAPGLLRAIMKNRKSGNYERSVSSSGDAMKILREQLGMESTHRLTIRPKYGAK
jgi:hypothetical protein